MQAYQSFRQLTLDLLQRDSQQLGLHQARQQQQSNQTTETGEEEAEEEEEDQGKEKGEDMAKRYFVETSPGRQFVSVKRSRSYGGHRNVREVDYVKVSLDEWNALVEKERKLHDANRSVVDECNALKSSLASSQADGKRLAADNDALRRSLDLAGDSSSRHLRDEDKLRARIAKLESEQLDLLERNRSLQKQAEGGVSYGRRVAELIADAEYWKDLSRSWRSRFMGLRQRYDEAYDLLDTRSKKLRAYEDILQRNGII